MNRLILSAGAHLTLWQPDIGGDQKNAATIVVSVEKEDGTPVRFIGESEFTISLLTVDGPLANPPILRPLDIEYFASSPVGDGHFFVLVVTDNSPDLQAGFRLLGGFPVVLAITVDEYTYIPAGIDPMGDFYRVLVARGHCIITCTQTAEIQRPLETKDVNRGT